MKPGLSEIELKVNELARVIGASRDLLPTFGYSEQSGRPHLEANTYCFHFIIAERGQEYHRLSSINSNEIQYEVFKYVTFEMASKYEVNNRVHGQDIRRIMFKHQEELSAKLSPDWSERRIQEHIRILEKHPFIDR